MLPYRVELLHVVQFDYSLFAGVQLMKYLQRDSEGYNQRVTMRGLQSKGYIQRLRSEGYNQRVTFGGLQSEGYNQRVTIGVLQLESCIQGLQSEGYNQRVTIRGLQSEGYNQRVTIPGAAYEKPAIKSRGSQLGLIQIYRGAYTVHRKSTVDKYDCAHAQL